MNSREINNEISSKSFSCGCNEEGLGNKIGIGGRFDLFSGL